MGKKDRPKAASAAAAAAAMHKSGTGGGFIGFGSFATPPSTTVHQDQVANTSDAVLTTIYTGSDQEIALALKNVAKKDVATRIKSLDELIGLVSDSQKRDKATIRSVIGPWIYNMERLLLDNKKRVRESTSRTTLALVQRIPKAVSKPTVLVKLLPLLLFAEADPNRDVSQPASEAIDTIVATWGEENHWQVVGPTVISESFSRIHAHTQLYGNTTQGSSTDSKMDAEERQERLQVTGILALKGLLARITTDVPSCLLEPSLEAKTPSSFTSFWSNPKTLKLFFSKRTGVQRAMYQCVSSFLEVRPWLFLQTIVTENRNEIQEEERHLKNLYEQLQNQQNATETEQQSSLRFENSVAVQLIQKVSRMLQQEDKSVVVSMLECVVLLCKQYGTFMWHFVDVQKGFLPNVWSLMRQGGRGGSGGVYSLLMPLLSLFPSDTWSSLGRASLMNQWLENLWSGLEAPRESLGPHTIGPLVQSLMECISLGWHSIVANCDSNDEVIELEGVLEQYTVLAVSYLSLADGRLRSDMPAISNSLTRVLGMLERNVNKGSATSCLVEEHTRDRFWDKFEISLLGSIESESCYVSLSQMTNPDEALSRACSMLTRLQQTNIELSSSWTVSGTDLRLSTRIANVVSHLIQSRLALFVNNSDDDVSNKRLLHVLGQLVHVVNACGELTIVGELVAGAPLLDGIPFESTELLLQQVFVARCSNKWMSSNENVTNGQSWISLLWGFVQTLHKLFNEDANRTITLLKQLLHSICLPTNHENSTHFTLSNLLVELFQVGNGSKTSVFKLLVDLPLVKKLALFLINPLNLPSDELEFQNTTQMDASSQRLALLVQFVNLDILPMDSVLGALQQTVEGVMQCVYTVSATQLSCNREMKQGTATNNSIFYVQFKKLADGLDLAQACALAPNTLESLKPMLPCLVAGSIILSSYSQQRVELEDEEIRMMLQSYVLRVETFAQLNWKLISHHEYMQALEIVEQWAADWIQQVPGNTCQQLVVKPNEWASVVVQLSNTQMSAPDWSVRSASFWKELRLNGFNSTQTTSGMTSVEAKELQYKIIQSICAAVDMLISDSSGDSKDMLISDNSGDSKDMLISDSSGDSKDNLISDSSGDSKDRTFQLCFSFVWELLLLCQNNTNKAQRADCLAVVSKCIGRIAELELQEDFLDHALNDMHGTWNNARGTKDGCKSLEWASFELGKCCTINQVTNLIRTKLLKRLDKNRVEVARLQATMFGLFSGMFQSGKMFGSESNQVVLELQTASLNAFKLVLENFPRTLTTQVIDESRKAIAKQEAIIGSKRVLDVEQYQRESSSILSQATHEQNKVTNEMEGTKLPWNHIQDSEIGDEVLFRTNGENSEWGIGKVNGVDAVGAVASIQPIGGKEVSVSLDHIVPILAKGSKVVYQSKSGDTTPVVGTITGVHLEDLSNGAYYTVLVEEPNKSLREIQTTLEHLRMFSATKLNNEQQVSVTNKDPKNLEDLHKLLAIARQQGDHKESLRLMKLIPVLKPKPVDSAKEKETALAKAKEQREQADNRLRAAKMAVASNTLLWDSNDGGTHQKNRSNDVSLQLGNHEEQLNAAPALKDSQLLNLLDALDLMLTTTVSSRSMVSSLCDDERVALWSSCELLCQALSITGIAAAKRMSWDSEPRKLFTRGQLMVTKLLQTCLADAKISAILLNTNSQEEQGGVSTTLCSYVQRVMLMGLREKLENHTDCSREILGSCVQSLLGLRSRSMEFEISESCWGTSTYFWESALECVFDRFVECNTLLSDGFVAPMNDEFNRSELLGLQRLLSSLLEYCDANHVMQDVSETNSKFEGVCYMLSSRDPIVSANVYKTLLTCSESPRFIDVLNPAVLQDEEDTQSVDEADDERDSDGEKNEVELGSRRIPNGVRDALNEFANYFHEKVLEADAENSPLAVDDELRERAYAALLAWLVVMREFGMARVVSVLARHQLTCYLHSSGFGELVLSLCCLILDLGGGSPNRDGTLVQVGGNGTRSTKLHEEVKPLNVFLLGNNPANPMHAADVLGGSLLGSKGFEYLGGLSTQSVVTQYGSTRQGALIALARYSFYETVRAMPALVREWWTTLGRTDGQAVTAYVASNITVELLREEIGELNAATEAGAWDPEELRVRGSVTGRTVTALYTKEDCVLEMEIQLPASYPLKLVQIEGTRRMGIREDKFRRWVLQIVTLMKTQDGSILDAIHLWKRNVDKEFEGIEPCPICYAVLHSSDQSLPKLGCTTCNNKFHARCLVKWFTSSHKNECPLCRSHFGAAR